MKTLHNITVDATDEAGKGYKARWDITPPVILMDGECAAMEITVDPLKTKTWGLNFKITVTNLVLERSKNSQPQKPAKFGTLEEREAYWNDL